MSVPISATIASCNADEAEALASQWTSELVVREEAAASTAVMAAAAVMRPPETRESSI